jgi:hypothetical protein
MEEVTHILYCEISSSHGGEYDVQSCLLGYTVDNYFTRQYIPEDKSEHILYSSPNIIRQIKSRRMRWAGHMAHMGEEKKCTGFW